MRLAGACVAYSGLGTALLVAAFAPAMPLAVRSAASFCRLEAALLLPGWVEMGSSEQGCGWVELGRPSRVAAGLSWVDRPGLRLR